MNFNRRSLLAMSAAGAATMFLPTMRRGKRGLFSNIARAQAGAGPLLITIEAHAAWDPTFLTDPKVDPAFTPWQTSDIRTATGTQIKYAPSLVVDANDNVVSKSPYVVGTDAQDFFQKHGQNLVVVNGIDNQTVSHDIGPRVAFTGSNREGIPSLAGLYAAAQGPTLPLALLTTGGFVNTEGLIPITRAGSVSVLLGLARSNIPNSTVGTSTRRFHDDGIMSLIRDRVRLRDQRRAGQASVPREAAGVARLGATRTEEVFTQFDELATALDSASSVQSSNPVIPQAAAVLAAMSAGACVSAHLVTSESFDTHTQHDLDHPTSMQNLLEIVDFVMTQAAADPNLASRGVMVVVGSDFGRTKYNGDSPKGKDHWPITAMMVGAIGGASSLIQGGRVVGETTTTVPGGGSANGVIAKKVKVQGGDLVSSDSASDITLTAGHVHVAIREALGFGVGEDLASKFPLTAVVPTAPLPILKPQ